MLGGFAFYVLLLAAAAAFIVVLLVVPRRRALIAVEDQMHPRLARLRRSMLAARVVALGVGLVVAVPLGDGSALGRSLMLIPAVFGAIQVLGVLVVDLTSRDAARTAGVAGVEVRRVRDFLPQSLFRYTAAAGAALLALTTWTVAAASPDDLGRAGRAFRYGCLENCTSGDTSGMFTPWPGSFYATPLWGALLGVLLLAGIALLVIVRRPRNGADPALVKLDNVIRRRSAESVVAAVGIATAGSLAGLGLIAGPRLIAQQNLSLGLDIAGWAITAAAAASIVLTVWCAIILMLPGAGPEPKHERSQGFVSTAAPGATGSHEPGRDSNTPRPHGQNR